MLLDLDGTENKKRLGANAMIATSLAIAKAAAVGAESLYIVPWAETTRTHCQSPY